MATNYSNATFIDLSQLSTPPNITIDIQPEWSWFDDGVKQIFAEFSWLEVAQSIGVFAVFYVLFNNQKILNLTKWQIILGASFMTILFNVFMHYGKYFTTFYPLGAFFIVWLVSLIATIRDT